MSKSLVQQRVYTQQDLKKEVIDDAAPYMNKTRDMRLYNATSKDYQEYQTNADQELSAEQQIMREFYVKNGSKEATRDMTQRTAAEVERVVGRKDDKYAEAPINEKKLKDEYKKKKKTYKKAERKALQKTAKAATVFTAGILRSVEAYDQELEQAPANEIIEKGSAEENEILNHDFLSKSKDPEKAWRDRDYDLIQVEYVAEHISDLLKMRDKMEVLCVQREDREESPAEKKVTDALRVKLDALNTLLQDFLEQNGIKREIASDIRTDDGSTGAARYLDAEAKKHTPMEETIKTLVRNFKTLEKASADLSAAKSELFEEQSFQDYYHRMGQSDQLKEENDKKLAGADDKLKKLNNKTAEASTKYPDMNRLEEEKLDYVINERKKQKKVQDYTPTEEDIRIARGLAKGAVVNAKNTGIFYTTISKRWSEADSGPDSRFIASASEIEEPKFYNFVLLARDYLRNDQQTDPKLKAVFSAICDKIERLMGKRNFVSWKSEMYDATTQARRHDYEMASQKNKGARKYFMLEKPGFLTEKEIEKRSTYYSSQYSVMMQQIQHLAMILNVYYLDKKLKDDNVLIDEDHTERLSEASLTRYEKYLWQQYSKGAA